MNLNLKIVKESAISFSGMGFGQFLRYIFTTLIARWVGVELLGIYSISNAITRIFEVIGKLGLDQGVIRAISREENTNKKKEVILSALKMGAISGIVIMIIQILIANWLVENIFNQASLLTKVIILHAISIPFYIIIHIAASSTQAYKILKYKIYVSEIQNPFILLLSMIFCYLYINSESAIIIPVLVASITGFIIINIFLKKITNVNVYQINQGIYNSKIINYSLPIMFMAMLGTILHWMDIIMLGYYTDTTIVGMYHPAARTAGIIRIILLSFSGIYGPIMAEMYAKQKKDDMNYIYKLVTRWIITIAFPFSILILIYSKKIMLIFGSEYLNGHSILELLVIAALIQAVFGIGGTTLNMTGFPKINFINTFVSCGLNIILNIILIPIMGGEGAALSTLISLIFIALLRCIQNWKLLNLNPVSIQLVKPFIAGIITIFFSLLIKVFIMPLHTIATLICATSIIFFIFFISLWVFGFNKDDMQIINKFKVILGLRMK